MNTLNQKIGQRMRALRESARMSQKELGDELSVDKSTISGYETGRIAPPLDIIRKLSLYFGVSADYLLGNTENPLAIRELDAQLLNDYTLGKMLRDFTSLNRNMKIAVATIVRENAGE